MVTRVRLKFEKFLHSTGKAILVRVGGAEHWIPRKLCYDLVVNKKLGGHVSVPTFIIERMGMSVESCEADVSIERHVPKKVTKKVEPIKELER